MLLTDARDEFLFDCECKHLAKGTIRNYKAETRFLVEFLELKQVTEVEEVKAHHIRDFMKQKQDAGSSACYVNDILKVCKTWFHYLVDEDYIEERRNPAAKVKNVRQPKTIIETFSVQEMKSLIHFYSGSDYLDVRNKTIITLLFDTGMRCNEMIQMVEEDIKRDYIVGMINNERFWTVLSSLEIDKIPEGKKEKMKSDEKLVIQIEKNETLGDFIQKCRQQYGWTQEELGWRTGITREHVGRIERGKCVPSVQTLYDLEKALNLPECSLVKRVNGQAEADVSQDSEEKEQVGRACRELELALAANLTKSNLRKASDAISTIAKMLNDTEMFSNKK